MIDAIRSVVAPLQRRIMAMVARAVVAQLTEGGALQRVQLGIQKDDTVDKIERIQDYGSHSVPKAGAEAVVLFLGGSRDHGIVIAIDDRRTRPNDWAEGDAGQYTASGAKLQLKDATKNLEGLINKLKLENADNDLVTVLSDLIQAIIDARTTTAFGPMPLLNPVNPFPTVKADLDTFKD